jgi:hypothetical protein
MLTGYRFSFHAVVCHGLSSWLHTGAEVSRLTRQMPRLANRFMLSLIAMVTADLGIPSPQRSGFVKERRT